MPSVSKFQQEILKYSGKGLPSYLLVKMVFSPPVFIILIDLKRGGHKTLGPKILSSLSMK